MVFGDRSPLCVIGGQPGVRPDRQVRHAVLVRDDLQELVVSVDQNPDLALLSHFAQEVVVSLFAVHLEYVIDGVVTHDGLHCSVWVVGGVFRGLPGDE